DILVTNDAYTTGSHLYHFTFSLPIFHRGKLSGFACCMAHWTDVGGVLGGVTTDIYSEGLQIPIVKYAKAGVVNRDLVDIIRMNVRIPERAGRLQVPHFPDRLPDQRRELPSPQGDPRARHRGERGETGGDALVDDVSDDGRGYRLQGNGAGDPGPHHRRAPRRPVRRAHQRHIAQGRPA